MIDRFKEMYSSKHPLIRFVYMCAEFLIVSN